MSNIERVYNAITRGHAQVGEIVEYTGLDEDTVRTAIRRLRDAGRVLREGYANTDDHRTLYGPVRSRCLLAEVWRGVSA